MKIKPRLKAARPYRARKRDGVINCDGPDIGLPTPHPKALCFTCRKTWRKNYGMKCPHCGGSLVYVNPWARIPRRANLRAWKRLERVVARRTR